MNRFSEVEGILHDSGQGDSVRHLCRISRHVCPVPESLLLLYPAVFWPKIIHKIKGNTEAWKQKPSVYLRDIASCLPLYNSD